MPNSWLLAPTQVPAAPLGFYEPSEYTSQYWPSIAEVRSYSCYTNLRSNRAHTKTQPFTMNNCGTFGAAYGEVVIMLLLACESIDTLTAAGYLLLYGCGCDGVPILTNRLDKLFL